MTTSLRRCLVLPVLLVLSCCLEFDAQDVVVRYDNDRDQLDALLIYRGLYAENGSSDDDMKKALKDLAETFENGEFCFWNNWPLSVDLTKDYPAPIQALTRHVDVENGTLFTDPKGVLCGYQLVRIRDAQEFIRKVNLLLALAAQAGLMQGFDGVHGPDHRVDDETRELLTDFLRSGEPLLVLEGNRVELRLPCSQQDLAWLLGQLEHHFLRNVGREIVRGQRAAAERGQVFEDDQELAVATLQQAPSYRFFWDNPISIERGDEVNRIAFGTADSDALRITKAPDGEYDTRLLEVLRERGDQIEDGLPDAELLRRFEQFRGRDAELPAELAALRQQ